MDYLYVKSLHIIFVVTWFSGLFYIVRLFVYYTEASKKLGLERQVLTKQYILMMYRLWYIITWPSAILASIFGFWMLFFSEPGKIWLSMSWMHVKLVFVFLLYLYHAKCHDIFLKLQNNQIKHSSNFLRLWNEIPSIILFAVVFLVILKNAMDWIYGVIGILAISILIMLGYKIYKKVRTNSKQ